MTSQDLTEFEFHFDGFINRFECALGHMTDHLQFIYDGKAATFLRIELEIPHGPVDEALSSLLRTWASFGHAVLNEKHRERLITELGQWDDGEVPRAFDFLEDGRLAAWQVSCKNGQLFANVIDGCSNSEALCIDAVTDHLWDDMPAEACYVGWLIDVGAGRALIQACELSGTGRQKLANAAQRSAWGQASEFRDSDYEEDILALAIDSTCFDTGSSMERVFLNPEIQDDIEWVRCELANPLQTVFHQLGFPSLSTQPSLLDPYRPTLDGAPFTTQLAAAFGDRFDAFLKDLSQARVKARSRCYYVARHFTPHALASVVPFEDLLADFHLRTDGSIDHPRPHNLPRYRLAATDLDAEWIHARTMQPEWNVRQTRAWAATGLEDEDQIILQQAIDRLYIALRWTALVQLHADEESHWLGPVNYDDLICGLHTRLPTRILETPLAEIDDLDRGTQNRLTAGLIEIDAIDDVEPPRLADLPHHFSDLTSLPRVGKSTSNQLLQAITAFVANWPDNAGHRPVDAAQTAEANSAIHSGLNELDDLF